VMTEFIGVIPMVQTRFAPDLKLAVGVLGSLALPKSPFWVGVVSSAVLVGAGYGWVR